MTEVNGMTNAGERWSCDAARLQIGAAPHESPAALGEHLAACEPCRQFQRETLAIERRVGRLLASAPHDGGAAAAPVARVVPLSRVPAAVPAAPRSSTARRFALAASVVAAVGLGVVLWASRPQGALASEVVAHMSAEPDSWLARDAVPASAVAFVTRKSGVSLASGPTVTYAHSCFFRGRWVPHLVVQTRTGPVTVLVLPGERVQRQTALDEAGYVGVLEPASGGVLAVLARDGNVAAVREAVRSVGAVVRW